MALQATWTPDANPAVLGARCARCKAQLGYAGPSERAVACITLHAGFVQNRNTEVWQLLPGVRAEWARRSRQAGPGGLWAAFVPAGTTPQLAQLPATVRCLCRAVNDITTAQGQAL